MKKSSTAAGASKKATGSTSSHPTYKEMIKDAIINLKERNGSSRQALKKYIQNNHTINVVSPAAFDSQFNKAIKNGVEKEEFFQPKGPSGTVKLAKKEPAPKAAAKPAAKPAAKKATTTKTTTAKKPTAKKPAAKATTTKKAAAPKKTTAAKPKANTAKPRKAPASAPAVVEVPKVLGKTKSGRVTKSTAAAPAPKKAAPAKGRTTKRASK